MNPLPTRCPVCGGDLVVTRLHCPSCETTLEGSFTAGASPLQEAFSPEQLRSLLPFARLSQDQLYFVLSFVRCEGRFNRMEEELGLSYPTLRGRLDEIIRALGFEPAREDAAREIAAREIAGRESAAREAVAREGAVAVYGSSTAGGATNSAVVNLPGEAERQTILDQLSRGEINLEEAKRRLRGEPPQSMPSKPAEPSERSESETTHLEEE